MTSRSRDIARAVRQRYRRLPLFAHPVILARHVRARRKLRSAGDLRLHLGCGQQRLEGFINIDLNPSPATDYVGSIVDLPCPAGSVERIESYHVIEHLPHPTVPAALRAWNRALRPGGTLVLECPDFDETVREYLAGNQSRIFHIFGLQRFRGDAHLFGYTPDSLTAMLGDAGFQSVKTAAPVDYHTADGPCFRVEATK